MIPLDCSFLTVPFVEGVTPMCDQFTPRVECIVSEPIQGHFRYNQHAASRAQASFSESGFKTVTVTTDVPKRRISRVNPL